MTVVEIDNIWKQYRYGVIGHGTLTHDLQAWWAKIRGKEDPNQMIFSNYAKARHDNGDFFWALKNINLSVEQGDIVGIIGKNGAGKSTLLKILSRITTPTKGCVKVKGRIASLLEVGTGFHPELTGVENVYLNGAILGMSKIEIKKKLDEIIDFSGVDKFKDTPVKRYSSGMFVRLAFAVAAHLDPEIMIIDEVLAVGDIEFQKKCIGRMGDIARKGRTILFVSHNMAAVEAICNKCVLIENGSITNEGNAKKIIDQYTKQTQCRNQPLIKEIIDRQGTGAIKFENIQICTNRTPLTLHARTGDFLEIMLNYKVCEVENYLCRFSISVDRGNESLLILDSLVTTGNYMELKSDGQVVFVIDKLPLSRGRYTINLYLATKAEVVLDKIDNVFELNVVDGDFYKTGYQYPDKNWAGKTVLIDYSFRPN